MGLDDKDKSAGPVPSTALEFFKQKKIKVGFSYLDVWRTEHLAAFTAAKIMEVDALQAMRDAVKSALAEGTTFQSFRTRVQNALTSLGWWGEKIVEDPETGKEQVVQINPRRLELIYDTNLRSARAAGQWDRIQRTKKLRPYLRYVLGPSKIHRPQHVAWAGIILPVDDPFWDQAFPPSAYNCRCSIVQITEKEAAKTGGPTKDFKYEYTESTNKRTGEVVRHIVGVDPTFAFNPGMDRFGGLRSVAPDLVPPEAPTPKPKSKPKSRR